MPSHLGYGRRIGRELSRPPIWSINAFFQSSQGKLQVRVFDSPRDDGFVDLNSFLARDVRAGMGALTVSPVVGRACSCSLQAMFFCVARSRQRVHC